MKIRKLVEFLSSQFPYKDAEKWDNCKSNTKAFYDDELSKVLVCLDLTMDVINKAIELECNFIISHHPIYIGHFNFLKRFIREKISLLKKNRITCIALHSNYDISNFSMSSKMVKLISSGNPIRYSKKSYGWIGNFNSDFNKLKQLIRDKWDSDYILSASEENFSINKFYFCSGAGSSELEKILNKSNDIDVFITGEIKWHIWVLAHEKKKILLDIGHSVELFFINDIKEILKKLNIDIRLYDNKLKLKIE
ncbi:MAG: Nif3-like dinuclear metal center hexameric protein [Mycoplasmoidaceae bacterium]